jgi:hypothetical protein
MQCGKYTRPEKSGQARFEVDNLQLCEQGLISLFFFFKSILPFGRTF